MPKILISKAFSFLYFIFLSLTNGTTYQETQHIRDENGIHYDSRKYHDNKELPGDADANGTFNIARKGLIMDAHIKQWIKDGSKVKDLDLFVSDEEWDLCLLNRNLWNEKLSYFANRSLKQKKN